MVQSSKSILVEVGKSQWLSMQLYVGSRAVWTSIRVVMTSGSEDAGCL